MNVKALICVLACLAGAPAFGQGFAGLGQAAEDYALPDPATRFAFPDDHGSHPGFRIEWWYITANLTDLNGTAYGIQWTLFRNALRPTGRPEDQAWMAHAALSSPLGHFSAERFARGGTGQAGVTAAPFAAHIDEWGISGPDLNSIRVTAQGPEFHYDLRLTATLPFVPQGQRGYSVKSDAGQASHYYSQPFYTVTGTLTLPGGPVTVTGQGWLDREWSSQPLAETQTGWDWISLHLDTGDKLMGFQLRDEDNTTYTVGTWIAPDGTPTPLTPDQMTMTVLAQTRVAGREVPTDWRVELPDRSVDIRVTAVYPDSWMDTLIPYWEGPVQVSGTHSGVGYLEMSGY
jgi:predicted secreted hydrolase